MKTCRNCKYATSSSSKDPCHTCCIAVDSDGNHIEYSLWEPKNFGAACSALFNEHSEQATDKDKKEEKKMDNRKTKAQLMEELEQKNAEIAELKKELERSANYEQYLDAAKEMRSMVDAFVESGFTEEQAIAIVTGVIGQAARQSIIR